MQYIISEEELLHIKYEVDTVKEYLKSKKPVEEIKTTCKNKDCISYSTQTVCLKGHKSCCNLLYISNDYFPK